MANFTALKTAINNAIKANGNEEITGAVLQVILDAMVETLGESAITNLENALAAEVTNRENAVGSVASDLTAEAEARAALDYQVNNRINQEEYNRQNADAALSQTMSQGFSTLGSQMNAISQAISALNAAYQNGFLYGGVITPSSSPANGKCFYIALQGGTYTNFGGVGVVQGINILKNDNGWKVEHIYDQTTLLNEFYLLRQQVIQAITSFAHIVIEGDVTNAPDEEDLTSNAQHLLQFKNNAYSPLEFSGLGRKYLRKNIAPLSESAAFNGFVEGVTAEETLSGTPEYIFWDRMNTRFVGIKDGVYYADWSNSDNYVPASTGLVYMYQGTPYRWDGSDFSVDETEVPNLVNCLTQDMINEANTIYIIRYDYTLKEDITIPAGCVLKFDGGSISGGSIICNNTQFYSIRENIFNNILFSGTISSDFKLSWIKQSNDGKYNLKTVKSVYDAIYNFGKRVIWDITNISFEVYDEFTPISLLNGENDFKDTNITIKNTSKTIDLFIKHNTFSPLSASTISDAVNNPVFSNNKTGILVVSDNTVFTYRNRQTPEAFYRADVLLVSNNILLIEPIETYDDGESNPSFQYLIPNHTLSIKNLHITRTPDSTYKTYCVDISGELNANIENITVKTTNNDSIDADSVITATFSIGTMLKNIQVYGTYSDANRSGYGIKLLQCTDTFISNFYTEAAWGVMDGTCVNKLTVRDSTLNRIDCHCYSKDFLIINCRLYNEETRISYHKGYVKYDSCILDENYAALANDLYYGCYTNVKLIINNSKVGARGLIVGYDTNIPISHTRRILTDTYLMPDVYATNCIFGNELYIYSGANIPKTNTPFVKIDSCTFEENAIFSFVGDFVKNVLSGAILYITNTNFNPLISTNDNRYTTNTLKFNLKNVRYKIISSVLAMFIAEPGVDAEGTVENSSVCRLSTGGAYSAVEKQMVFKNCEIILDSYRNNDAMYLPRTTYQNCHFVKPSGRNILSLILSAVRFENCTKDSDITIDGNDLASDIFKKLILTSGFADRFGGSQLEVSYPVTADELTEIKKITCLNPYTCVLQDGTMKYIINKQEVTKEVYYG